MKIKINEKLKGFRYFWAKRVKGFDNTHHCAKCLIGSYVKAVGVNMEPQENVEANLKPGEVLYVCGVSLPYAWKNNFHIALEEGEETITRRFYNGQEITFEGVKEIPFEGKLAFERYSKKGLPFTTCRNFQFGVHYFEGENNGNQG